jgi:hypothetical protein
MTISFPGSANGYEARMIVRLKNTGEEKIVTLASAP